MREVGAHGSTRSAAEDPGGGAGNDEIFDRGPRVRRIVPAVVKLVDHETTRSALAAAMDLAAAHRLRIWDSIIIAVAVENRCRLLLSEDLQDGFIWGGLTVVNPFAVPRMALLVSLLEGGTKEETVP